MRIPRIDADRPSLILLAALAVLAPSVRRCSAGESPALADKDEQTQRESPQLGEKWVRLVRDKSGKPLAMQTAIVRYAPVGEGETSGAGAPARYLDLVGAVHVGDRSYYAALNQRFRSYDAVLYELVAPEGTVVPKGRGTSNSNPLGALQNGMKTMLEVEHQLDRVDYTKRNFVHADLSPREFAEAMS
ncbi:MAG: hypothetical protein AAF961_18400, partial [Planctomycetota bacterium]